MSASAHLSAVYAIVEWTASDLSLCLNPTEKKSLGNVTADLQVICYEDNHGNVLDMKTDIDTEENG